MSKRFRCMVGQHKWKAKGDDWGPFEECVLCGKRKRLGGSIRAAMEHDNGKYGS